MSAETEDQSRQPDDYTFTIPELPHLVFVNGTPEDEARLRDHFNKMWLPDRVKLAKFGKQVSEQTARAARALRNEPHN